MSRQKTREVKPCDVDIPRMKPHAILKVCYSGGIELG
jgi:hypothetical protein